MSALDQFRGRLRDDWLIPFCSARGFTPDGYIGKSLEKLSEIDARDFMLAVDTGIVQHCDGKFTAPCSKVEEQIFSHGDKRSRPRIVYLWLEPIITIAALARLVTEYGWPVPRLGMQSQTWAFDLVAYEEDQSTEALVCEVKKSRTELDRLVSLMRDHAETPDDAVSEYKGSERNALKKVVGLRQSNSRIFWALGPNRYGYVFNVIRQPNGGITLHEIGESVLFFNGA